MPRSATTTDEYDVITHEDACLSEEVVTKIRAWLQPTDYLAESGEFRRHLLSRAPDTGLWLTKTNEFRQWQYSPDTGSLWIKGVAGSGKSVVAASVIQHLKATEDTPVLFFFFRNIVAANFEPRSLIQDWLAQLLPHSTRLQFALKPRIDSRLEEVSETELVDIFLDGLSGVPRVYCVADALDEMTSENKPFLDKLNSLATYRPRAVKLLMTSRPKQYLQSALRDSSIVQISLEKQLVDPEIAAYLTHRLDDLLKSNPQGVSRDRLIQLIAERSKGLFLYAKLTMDQVANYLESANTVDLDRLATSLPSGLEETYNSMLSLQRRTQNITVELQALILEAIIYASRPLRLNELASLIQLCKPDAAPAGQFKRFVASSCGPLIEILEDETLQVLHHSLTEFLRGETRDQMAESEDFPIMDTLEAHKRMAVNCMRYLRSGALLLEEETSQGGDQDLASAYIRPSHLRDLDEEYAERRGRKPQKQFDYQQAKLRHAFLSYAVDNVNHHASRYDLQDEAFYHEVEAFVDPRCLEYHRWLTLVWGTTSLKRGSLDGVPGVLHFASFCGLAGLVHKALNQGQTVETRDAQLRQSIHWAAEQGHATVTTLLLDHGADAAAEDGRGQTPLHLAAGRNRAAVVGILLQHGVDPTAVKTKENHAGRLLGGETITQGECAILYVSQRGHLEATEAMIPFCKDPVLEQLLCECCRFSRTDAVLSILKQTDVSSEASYRGATALYHACATTNFKCAQALVKRGADVNKTSIYESRRTRNGGGWPKGEERAPLHALVRVWSEENNTQCQAILKLLIDAGADLEPLDYRGDSPLMIAAGHSNSREPLRSGAIRALLEVGGNAKRVDKNGDTVLHRTFKTYRDPEAVRLLVERGGIDPNLKGCSGYTALHGVLHQPGMVRGVENTQLIIEYLLSVGADPSIKDDHGRTAIEVAVSGDLDIFRTLLPYCADLATKQRCWFFMDAYGKREKVEPIVDLLLAQGVDVDCRNRHGRTLLLAHPMRDVLGELLRERGAKFDTVDHSGRNLLHLLVDWESNSSTRKYMEKYIAEGIDPLSTDHTGYTLLHLVATWYRGSLMERDLVHWLIGLGISVNATDREGRTPLHVYVDSNHVFNTHRSKARVSFIEALTGHEEQLQLDARDNYATVPLHIAVTRSHVETHRLVQAGADISILDSNQRNVLHLACQARQSGIVGYLVQRVELSHMNAQDSDGRRPLHYACLSGQIESVAYLLRAGADARAKTPDGQTALHFCAEHYLHQKQWSVKGKEETIFPGRGLGTRILGFGRRPWYKPQYGSGGSPATAEDFVPIGSIAAMLIESGVNAAAINDDAYSALDVALETGCSELIELFASDPILLQKMIIPTDDGAKDPAMRIKAQMQLMRPIPSLHRIATDDPIYDEILNYATRYLKWLRPADMDLLFTHRGHDLLWLEDLAAELIKFGCEKHFQHTAALQRWVRDSGDSEHQLRVMQAQRESKKQYYGPSPDPALHLVCGREESSMQLLRTMVETCQANVNARASVSNRRSSPEPGGTALHVLAGASSWWQLEGIRYQASKHADLNAVDERGRTPLHIAARGMTVDNMQKPQGFWRADAVSLLLDLGANPNILDQEGLSALNKASNSPDIMKELLKRGADPTKSHVNPVFQAIESQSLGALAVMLDNGASVDSLDDRSDHEHYKIEKPAKKYALLAASLEIMNTSRADSAPLLRLLVERGANLYLPINDMETLIHWLFEVSEYEIVNTLMEDSCVARIDFNARAQTGKSVLMAAANNTECLPGYSHRHWESKHTGFPVRILDTGRADATLTDNDGKTALHHMLHNPDMEDDVVLQFLDRPEVKPTLFTKDSEGYNPLHYAFRVLRPAAVESLLSKGVNVLTPDPQSKIALHYIADQCLQIHRDRRNQGRLQIDQPTSFFEQSLTLWNKFLSAGGDINARDENGDPPLFTYLASQMQYDYRKTTNSCHIDYFEKLFPSNCEVDLQAINQEGESALHIVAKRSTSSSEHDEKLFEMLMKKGLDALKEDNKGRSALDVASACGQEGIVGLLSRTK